MASITAVLDVANLPPTDPFLGAALKTKWACQHIKEIDASIFETFFAGGYKADVLIKDSNLAAEGKPPKFRYVNRVREDTLILSTYSIHNLRSALDHVACAISTAPNRKEASFVIGEDANEFERVAAKRQKEGRLCADAIDFMRCLKPYKGGDDRLWALHRLNIMDKHRMLILVEPRGQKRAIFDNSPVDYSAGDWETFEGRPDFYTRPLPNNPNAETRTAFSVAFDKVETIENQPLTIVIANTATLIAKIIGQARKCFPNASPPPI